MSNDIIQFTDYTLKYTLKYDHVMFPCSLCKWVADDTCQVLTCVLSDLTQVGSSKPDTQYVASSEGTNEY